VQKRDCFDVFCEALIADGQDHIVNKYLKQTKSFVAAPEPVASSANTSSPQASAKTSENIPSESTDSMDRIYQPRTPSIVIRESDNKHVYIRYNDEASPSKRPRGMDDDTSLILYEPGEARYAMKHFVSDSAEVFERGIVHKSTGKDSIPTFIMDNPQSILFNSNISDPDRYVAAFKQQSCDVYHSTNTRLGNETCQPTASLPLSDHPSKKNDQNSLSDNDIRNLLRPNSNTHASLINQIKPQNRGKFLQ
jgi:hypothetical protein